MLIEREIASAFPGRGMPKEQLWLDEGNSTGFGPLMGLSPDERDGLIDFLNSQVLTAKSQRAVIRGLNLSSAFARDLPEYDSESMEHYAFLPKRQVDGLSRIGTWAEISWRRLSSRCRRYEEATVLLGGVCGRERSENTEMGTCKAVVESPSSSLSPHVAEVDVSMMLRDGSEARVLGPCGPDGELGSVSVWTVPALGREAALLVGSLADETNAEEAAEHLERWRWLSTFRDAPEVRMGMAPLSERNLIFLGVGVGDELTVVGFGDHIEIWNPVRWDEETSDFEEDLLDLLNEYAVVSDEES